MPKYGKTLLKYVLSFLEFFDEVAMAYNQDLPDNLKKHLSESRESREVIFAMEAVLNIMETLLNPIDSFLSVLSKMDTGGAREAYDDYPGGAF